MKAGRIAALVGVVALATLAVGGSCGEAGKRTKDTVERGENAGQQASFGDALTLQGFSGRLQMQVIPTRLLDPLEVGQLDKPLNKNARFVGVEVEMENVGEKTYSDSPQNGATVVTADSQQGDPTIVLEGPCSGGFSSNATIAPGDTLKGCIPFEVPGDAPVEKFQLSLESGFGPESGEWTVE